MFGWGKERGRRQHLKELRSQVDAIQTRMVVMVRRELVKDYGTLAGSQLAQATVDRLFARPAGLSGESVELVKNLSHELARENKFVRDAAFVTLVAMLELEGAANDFKAERRIIETLDWLRQYGEPPTGLTLEEVNRRLMMEENLPQIVIHKREEKDK